MNPNHTIGAPLAAAGIKAAYTATAGTTVAIPATADGVRVTATSACFIEISVAGTPAVVDTGVYLAAGASEYFPCQPSSKVSAVQLAAPGTIYVTPVA